MVHISSFLFRDSHFMPASSLHFLVEREAAHTRRQEPYSGQGVWSVAAPLGVFRFDFTIVETPDSSPDLEPWYPYFMRQVVWRSQKSMPARLSSTSLSRPLVSLAGGHPDMVAWYCPLLRTGRWHRRVA